MPIRVSGGISGLIYRKLINEFFREITGEAGETSGRIPAKFPWIFLRRILEGKFFVEEVRISGGVLREIARRTTARTAKVIPVVTPKKSSWINLRRRNPQKKKKKSQISSLRYRRRNSLKNFRKGGILKKLPEKSYKKFSSGFASEIPSGFSQEFDLQFFQEFLFCDFSRNFL